MDKDLLTACSAIDRLATVEARISVSSRGVIEPLYAAAFEAQGRRPLCLLAADLILEHAKPGKTVFITTGAGDPRFMPAGETDGPPGAAALAVAIHAATGAVPVLLTEAEFIENLSATAAAAGLGLRSPEYALKTPFTTTVLPLAADDGAKDQAKQYLDTYAPTLLVSTEKIGPNADGVAHMSSGTPAAGSRARAEHLFDIGAARGIASIGIGDNGNEIGFGRISDAVKRWKPGGERLATRVATDVLFPANISNWGAYAVIAALAIRLQRPDLLHDADTERRMIEACVATNAVDGSTGRHILAVDGTPLAMQQAVVTMLAGMVRNALIKGYKRPF
ncbi:MAG: glutamate cyclase domain-containing protein [Hyphomicrobiaceae bacterium]